MPSSPRIPPLFLVSLERHSDRRTVMEERLRALGLEYRIEKAVDGMSLSDKEIAEAYDENAAKRILRRPLFKGEVGLSLTSKAIYQKMIAEDMEDAVIIEDDVELSEDFPEVLANRHRLPADWSIVQLVPYHTKYPAGIAFSRCAKDVHLHGIHHAQQYLGASYGSQAYLIRRTYAEELLPQLSPVTLPIDTLLFDNLYSLQLPYAIFSREGLNRQPRLGRHTWMPTSTHSESQKEGEETAATHRLGKNFHAMSGLLSPMHLLLMLLSFLPLKKSRKLNIQAHGKWSGKLSNAKIYLSSVQLGGR